MIGGRFGLAALLLAGVGLAASPVAADCALRLDHPGRIDVFAGETYQVFGRASLAVPIDFTVRGQRQGCAFALGFSSAGARDGLRVARDRGHRLKYRLSPDRRGTVRLADLPQARGAELLRGAITGRAGRFSGRYYIVVDEGQGVAAGAYQDTVRVTLIDLTTARRLTRVDLRLRFPVPGVLEARFVIEGSRRALGGYGHALDFGDLKTGLRRGLDIEVLANQGFSVTLASEGGGVMGRRGRMPGPVRGQRAGIPYRLHIRGQTFSLERPVRLSARRGIADGRHDFPLVFEIGSTDRVLAGAYSDIIRLTVAAD
ncbi:MAG: hypothetical protein ACFB6R_06230 [Alphaproteobacteria bacterium]